MKLLVVLALSCLAVASAQPAHGGQHHQKIVLDYVHNYRFEEFKKKNHTLLIAISDVRGEKRCHIIEADQEMRQRLHNVNYMRNVTEEIYNLIVSGNANEMKVNHSQIFHDYHEHKIVNECRHHKTFALEYVPGFEMDPNMVNTHGTHHNNHHHHHHSTHKPHHNNHHHSHHHGHHHHPTTPSVMV